MSIGETTKPVDWLTVDSSAENVDQVINFLTEQGTFHFPTLSTGVFSAAAADDPEFRLTGYQNVWVRDNIHVAHTLWVIGETDVAVRAIEAFVTFYVKYQQKFVDILEGKTDPAEIQSRPHIRFDGENLSENEEAWAHAQNDALGYFLWLTCKLLRSGDLKPSSDIETVLSLLVQYLHKIQYWQDEDSGHWEETRKIEASSIGTVVAGLNELQHWLTESQTHLPQATMELLLDCLNEGKLALAEILPNECIQPAPEQQRAYDSALLFLCYPLEVVDEEIEAQIAENVRKHLMEPIGIKRYIGDSYWCANYRTLLPAETRTTDYSDDMSGRDSLLVEGQEAQWCIFDPILSIIYGRRYQEYQLQEDRDLQLLHLQRALAQLTSKESRFPAYRCPESYFLEDSKWIPNDICPLLWTQANLRLALHWMKKTCAEE